MYGLRLVEAQSLLRIVQRHAKFDECGALIEVTVDLACQNGLVTKMSVFRTLCEKEEDT